LAYALYNDDRLYYKRYPKDVIVEDFKSIVAGESESEYYEQTGESPLYSDTESSSTETSVSFKEEMTKQIKKKKKVRCIRVKPISLEPDLLIYEVEPKSDSSEIDEDPQTDGRIYLFTTCISL